MNTCQKTRPVFSLQNRETSPPSPAPQTSHALLLPTGSCDGSHRHICVERSSRQALCQPSRFTVLDPAVSCAKSQSSGAAEPGARAQGAVGVSRWGRQGLRAGGLLSGPLIPQCAARVHSGKPVSPCLQPLGPDILLSGLGEAQNLMPSAFGQRVGLDEILGGVFLR